jgi:beta-glucosidase/6-phospho-beta-glucosidase/beta-galactosidase
MYPEGLYLTLKDIKKYSLPILITENGIPDSEDKKRAWFIGAYVAQVHRAIEDGIGVIGYMHWSLIDNWEWWDGFGGRFGLAETNFDTFERKLRKSGEFYGQIAKNNSLPDEMPELKP